MLTLKQAVGFLTLLLVSTRQLELQLLEACLHVYKDTA